MTEKEKRASGILYHPFSDSELSQEYRHAAELLFKLNSICLNNYEARFSVLKELFGKVGERCTIVSPFHCDFGYNVSIDNDFCANANLVILDCAKVDIGKNVFIGPNVGIYTVGHPEDKELRAQKYEYAHPIKIGNDVWIGGNACILPGVTIGDNVIIGAGSVVTKDIPDNSVAVGNPCKVIRKITEKLS